MAERHAPGSGSAGGTSADARVPGPGDRPALAVHRSGAGPPVVLVHGFTQTAASWRTIISSLAGAHEVLAVDLPGHGGSSNCYVASISDAAALVGDAGGRASYVGYSLGGRCCLTLALERPDLVERLVLVGATAGIEDDTERVTRRRADEALAERLDRASGQALGVEGFLREWLTGPLFAHLSPEQADIGSRLTNTLHGLAASLRTMGTGTQVPSFARLGALEMPVLLVTGEKDERFGTIARRMADAIGANARHEVVPGAGHAVPFEAPEAFAEVVERHLGAET